MIIGIVQFSPVWEDKNANMKKLTGIVTNSQDTDLIIFPEMTLTGFTMKSHDHAETFNGETFLFFSNLAKSNHSAVMYGFIEKGKNRAFNTLVHLNNQGKIINTYRKLHPFSYAKEDIFFGRGKKIITTKVKNINIGLSICYDLRFPELFRYYAKKNVHLIINIANWPDTRIEHWRTLLKARAIENQCYVAGINRVGNDPALIYNGFSSVFNPMGEQLASLENDEQIVKVNIEKSVVIEVRNKLPFLKDIRLI